MPQSSPPSAPAPASRFAFRHFRTRVLAFILLLVLLLQAMVFFFAGEAAKRNAMRASNEALLVTLATLTDTMAVREGVLRKNARLTANDYAFKTLVSESDHATLISAFPTFLKRLEADWIFVLDTEGMVMADSLNPRATQVPFSQPQLIKAIEQNGGRETSSVQIVGGKAFQVVVVPLLAPIPVAWIGVGHEITDKLARDLERQTHTQVNLGLRPDSGAPTLFASTLNVAQRQDFLSTHTRNPMQGASHVMALGEVEFLAIEKSLYETAQGPLVASLHRPLAEALADYRRLGWQLLAVAVISSLLAAVAAIFIARRVTRPVQQLAQGARRISAGHYDMIGDVGSSDEFGALAGAFDNMVRGLIERDKVRAMLGKVVSPAIAEELLSQSIDFGGGQEQEVSVLFSDIRGFTTLCEGRAPSAILSMLNEYLSTVSDLIDERNGVVDKYIGDAVMALFGAPLSAPDDPQRALETALAMVRVLPGMNAQFARDGWPPLHIGIGIHSGIVVAGNIGSSTRLNYTVLGDTVNLASRLEDLCKYYGVPIVVSDTTMRRTTGVVFRELDLVRVKGKTEPVGIFAAIGFEADVNVEQRAQLALHAQALASYRDGQFLAAQQLFAALPQDAVTALYQARCQRHIDAPPGAGWDMVETLHKK
ncbi:MAG: adenylate/guanylate cyclase domain-containing protein [Pseudomonadota bacterium]